ncbi:MAG: hypothetical protein JOY85_13015 [Acidobacteriaceae bacterium]|nr:hypothetical protein [Acidobacteriaceae bacterium]
MPKRLINLGFVILSSTPTRAYTFGTVRDSLGILPNPGGAPGRDSRPSPPTRRSAALGEAAETDPGGSTPVDLDLCRLEGMAVPRLSGPSGDRDGLAPERLPSFLEREGSAGPAGQAERSSGDSRMDPHHES